MELWTALLMGFGGSVHCVGMCGPLALALAGGHDPRARFVAGRLLYNAGRTVTYALLGGLFGLLGGSLRVAGWQQGLSVAVGAALLVGAVRRRPLPGLGALVARGAARLQQAVGGRLRVEGLPGLFVVGLLNGLLPCGLVYVALAASLASGGPLQGMGFMALFGAGTIPLMLATCVLGRALWRHDLQVRLARLLPVGLALLGVLFVLRGLGLGIPYLSPLLEGTGHAH